MWLKGVLKNQPEVSYHSATSELRQKWVFPTAGLCGRSQYCLSAARQEKVTGIELNNELFIQKLGCRSCLGRGELLRNYPNAAFKKYQEHGNLRHSWSLTNALHPSEAPALTNRIFVGSIQKVF